GLGCRLRLCRSRRRRPHHVRPQYRPLSSAPGGGLRRHLRHRLDQVPMKNRIADLRAERAWTPADLAARVGISRQSINAIETGKFDPSLPVAFRLARLFGLPIEHIFADEPSDG